MVGKIIKVKTLRNDMIAVVAGGTGAVNIPCFDLHVSFGYEVDQSYRTGIQTVQMCDWADLNQLRNQLGKKLVGSTVTVVYSTSNPELAFVTELISKPKLKFAVALSVALLILVTWAVGIKTGIYKIEALNVPLTSVQPRFVLIGFALILFYV